MNASRAMASLYIASLAIESWAPIKKGYYPWPPMIIRSSIAFAMLSLLSLVSDELAVALASGFVLAQLIKMSSGTTTIPDWIYHDLTSGPPNPDFHMFNAFGLMFNGTTGVK